MTQDDIDNFTRMLEEADGKVEYQSWEAWRDLIAEAIKQDEANGYTKQYRQWYSYSIRNPDSSMRVMANDQLNNVILGSLALYQQRIPRHMPLVVHAANGSRLSGGNIANLRTILMMGFDPNVGANIASPALEYAVSGSPVRAVECLLQAGADPNLESSHPGYSIFASLCNAMSDYWFEGYFKSLVLMLEFGANANLSFEDGPTALDNLKKTEERDPAPLRRSFIDMIEGGNFEVKYKPFDNTFKLNPARL